MPFDGKIEDPDVLIIEKAQELLMTGGWCRGFMRSGSEYCLVGAIRAANPDWITGTNTIPNALQAEAASHGALIDDGWHAASYWNDNQAEDRDAVIEFLDCVKVRVGHANRTLGRALKRLLEVDHAV